MSKGGGSQTQKTEPWSGQQPYLKDAYQQAQNLYRSGGPEFFPNATYVPFSAQSQMGMDLMTNRALQGSQMQQPANNYALGLVNNGNQFTQQAGQTFANTANGSFLNANPYLDSMFGNAANQVTQRFNEGVAPGLNATFGASGRTGGGAHGLAYGRAAGELGDTLGSMATDIYGGNYQAERDRMMAAAAGLGSVGSADVAQRMQGANLGMGLGQQEYADINNLMGVGQMVEGKAGEVLGDQMNRFSHYQNRPEQQMNNYTSWLSGIPSNGGTTTMQGGGSGMGGAIGGASALGGLGAALGATGPVGWGLAGLGGLLGMFS
jgi:hypothetical protein